MYSYELFGIYPRNKKYKNKKNLKKKFPWLIS